MTIESVAQRRRFGRKIQGIAAALLPFEASGEIAVEAFQRHLLATHHAGLGNAVNMDTGYVNLLDDATRETVLQRTRVALGEGAFVAGAYVADAPGAQAASTIESKTTRLRTKNIRLGMIFSSLRLIGETEADTISVIIAQVMRLRKSI